MLQEQRFMDTRSGLIVTSINLMDIQHFVEYDGPGQKGEIVAVIKVYRFIEDPGHGWIEVPRLELIALNIEDKISSYSYQSDDGLTVYLEEDCDMSVFCRAKGWTPGDAHTNWKSEHQENTFVRNLPSYRQQ